MVRTASGALYTGISTDPERRLRQHRGELAGGARCFRADPAIDLVWREPCPDRATASRREAAIKRMDRQQKLELAGLR